MRRNIKGVPLMSGGVIWIQLDGLLEFSFGIFPVPVPEHSDESKRRVWLGERVVYHQSLVSHLLRLRPIHHVERVSVSQPRVTERVVRVLPDCLLEVRNALRQSVVGSSVPEE